MRLKSPGVHLTKAGYNSPFRSRPRESSSLGCPKRRRDAGSLTLIASHCYTRCRESIFVDDSGHLNYKSAYYFTAPYGTSRKASKKGVRPPAPWHQKLAASKRDLQSGESVAGVLPNLEKGSFFPIASRRGKEDRCPGKRGGSGFPPALSKGINARAVPFHSPACLPEPKTFEEVISESSRKNLLKPAPEHYHDWRRQ